MLHVFATSAELPERFPNPFDETGPHGVAIDAAQALMRWLKVGSLGEERTAALEMPGGGKMFGVLVVKTREGPRALWAFSGQLSGAWQVPSFVGPTVDIARWASEERHEKTIERLTAQIVHLDSNQTSKRPEAALQVLRAQHRVNKAARDRLRQSGHSESELAAQSRRDKAEWKKATAQLAEPSRSEVLRRRRAVASASLMLRYFDCYQLQSFSGAPVSLRVLFAPQKPPGGAGDCCGPKLLQAAQALCLEPVALAEFWWGAAQRDGGRQPGTFSPACTPKCGPLLPALLEGIDVAARQRVVEARKVTLLPTIRYQDDDVMVVEKPPGLLSVPGRASAAASVESWVQTFSSAARVAHRLDQETSGLMVLALTEQSLVSLQRQFSSRLVRKVYLAVVQGQPSERAQISLPLRGDHTDRPRQRFDPAGKPAHTDVSILRRDSKSAVVGLRPLTGRTHQLRVHCAHVDGLGAPIVGDALYGWPAERMLLHAQVLSFAHPRSGQPIQLVSRSWPDALLHHLESVSFTVARSREWAVEQFGPAADGRWQWPGLTLQVSDTGLVAQCAEGNQPVVLALLGL